MLAVADRRELGDLASGREQRHLRVPEAERREAAQLAAQLERQLRAAGQDRVDDGRRHEIHLLDRTFCVRGERIGERLDRFRRDRQAGSCTMASETLEERRARCKTRMQVEGRNRTTGPLPQPVGAGDQDDGPVIALDEPRGDNADDAFVPVLAPEDIRVPPPAGLGPLLDLLNSRPQNPLLDNLPVAIQLL